MMTLVNSVRKSFKYFRLSDVILIILILSLATYIFISNLKNKSNQFVRINYQNNLWGQYPLNQDKIIKINDHIEVEIANNQVRMLRNDCPNQLCVKQGWSKNYPIICVPNQVEIIVIDQAEKNVIRKIIK